MMAFTPWDFDMLSFFASRLYSQIYLPVPILGPAGTLGERLHFLYLLEPGPRNQAVVLPVSLPDTSPPYFLPISLFPCVYNRGANQ